MHFERPFQDPVLVFTLVLLIIFFAPILMRKLRIPDIIGLIAAGVIIGPHGTHLLERNSSIVLFGTIGLLYIMFLAGLELDLGEFKRNRSKSLIFGALTFLVPLSIGTYISIYILHYSIITSLMLSSMFSSHTLVAYPIASRLGLTRQETVTIAVGGTIITDMAVLLLLAFISKAAKGHLDFIFIAQLVGAMLLFSAIVFWGFSRIARWFFKNLQGEGTAQYILVMGLVFAAAFLAELAGVEPIIGAFLAGLALNPLVPHSSPLMNRIEFIGQALFIPFFLISVGMLVDLSVLFHGYQAITIAAVLTITAIISKWLAAFISQKLFRYTNAAGQVLFGLSSAHAAATLAVVLVGYNLGILDKNVLNATIILILITCIVSSFVTEKAGRKLVLEQKEREDTKEDGKERILVPIANPQSIESLIEFALMLKSKASQEPVFPLSVVYEDSEAEKRIRENNKLLERAIKLAAAVEVKLQLVAKVDTNVSAGIARSIRELLVTQAVIGWNGRSSARDVIFGSVLDTLVSNTEKMIWVCHLVQPLNLTKIIHVLIPQNAQYEKGFHAWVSKVGHIGRELSASLHLYGDEQTLNKVKGILEAEKMVADIICHNFDYWHREREVLSNAATEDMFIIIKARKHTISYLPIMDEIPKTASRYLIHTNFIFLYPEQTELEQLNINALGNVENSPIQENFDRLARLGGLIRWPFRRPPDRNNPE